MGRHLVPISQLGLARPYVLYQCCRNNVALSQMILAGLKVKWCKLYVVLFLLV